MRSAKKWLAIALCTLLAFGQAVAVIAEDQSIGSIENALKAGREASLDVSFQWHDLPHVTDEVNEMLTALFGALELHGRTNDNGEESYASMAMRLSGEDAVTIDTVVEGDTFYMVMPEFSTPFMLKQEDAQAFAARMTQYFNEMTQQAAESYDYTYEGEYSDEYAGEYTEEYTVEYTDEYSDAYADQQLMANMFSLLFQRIAEITEEFPDDPVAAMAKLEEEMGLTGLNDAAAKWVEENMEMEMTEGDAGSMFEVTTASYGVVTMDRNMMIDYFEEIMPLVLENEDYWSFIIGIYDEVKTENDPEISAAEMKEQVPEMMDQVVEALGEVPEDFIVTFCFGYNEAGEIITTQIIMDIPAVEGESEEIVFFAEWLPEGIPLYAEFFSGGNGATLLLQPNEAEGDDGFAGLLTITEDGEPAGQFVLETSSVITEEEGKRVWDASLTAGMVADEEQVGVEIVLNQVDTFTAEDVRKDITMDVSLIDGAEAYDVMTITAVAETMEAQGAPFDISEVEFADLAAMDDEAFNAFMENMTVTSMQGMMKVLSMMPAEVLSMFMGE